MEKFIFTIDNESQYFVSENRVIYWKNDFQKFFDVEKMFSQQGEGVVNFTPPSRVAEKTSKSVKFLPTPQGIIIGGSKIGQIQPKKTPL